MSGDGEFFIGIDVGTGSARAALVDSSGKIIRSAVLSIKTWNPRTDFYQQSSDNIWDVCCSLVKEITDSVPKASVKGIGFDATCSLVALDAEGKPLSVSVQGEPNQNIILWMDHRAVDEAAFINGTGHPLLRFVGGTMSLEMDIPKLLWLKNNLTDGCWKRAGYFFNLADFLSWKATGDNSRSSCTVICKWAYDASVHAWNREFFDLVGLSELLEDDCRKIGCVIQPPGSACGSGLSEEAAAELGLLPGTPVATSIIDAHAGVLGLIGARAKRTSSTTGDEEYNGNASSSTQFDSRLSLICGTSTCHMALSRDELFVKGVWGPYRNVLGMDMWLSEGGQSATGKLLDHIIDTHPVTIGIRRRIPDKMHIVEYLNELLKKMTTRTDHKTVDFLTKDIHVWPDFHGNRSPVADPSLRGMISGLSLSSTEEDLAVLYLAVVQSLAYSTKHIISTLLAAGHKGIDTVLICGGLSKNSLFLQVHADVLGCEILIPEEQESVLLGSAMLAATAAKTYNSVRLAATEMSCMADVVKPNRSVSKYHEKKYAVFLRMLDDQNAYREIMK